MSRAAGGDALELDEVRALVGAVPDPELPVVTIAELGILRGVERDDAGTVVVTITPTYSGCPAMDAIRQDVARVLDEHGVGPARVRTVLAPAWSTDWLTDAARRKLAEHGIAPPGPNQPPAGGVFVPLTVRCPRCGQTRTRELSHFGPTACQSLWVCAACGEPFSHVKAI